MRVHLNSNQLQDSGTTQLGEAIKVNTYLNSTEALMVNSTLFKLVINISGSIPSNVREILLGKGDMNRWGHLLPRIINNDPKITVLKLNIDYLSEAATVLCEALMLNSTITSLDRDNCEIGDLGAVQL